ncbi:hypothetical protein DCCM_4645 [Desulfocucumis palustris]|uniref:Uncharacterized protein n=1 Tax=Desulfocucumis palustris TaxID=1898651 RepID=A0A2L2XMF6_9FIRM|nr:hypothetical protein DCCM_4645 [Desulfocucumis palustris]
MGEFKAGLAHICTGCQIYMIEYLLKQNKTGSCSDKYYRW